ncbi:MAG: ABC transporter permease [Bacteroidales bacterium]|nr:ABC transporter permease [Bacteroidales bacterium]MDD4672014.1 ABC transporter permease [Bacteroidales bacterium]
MKPIANIIIYVKLIRESMSFAYQSIKVNKMRTFLSLFGITIGIFAIVSVFTVLDSLEKSIRQSLDSLGDNVVYVQKWPWSMGGNYPWWKYMNRPQPSLDDLKIIRSNSITAQSSALQLSFRSLVEHERSSAPKTIILAVTDSYEDIRSFEIESGRYFSAFDLSMGRRVAVLGYDIATELFVDVNPVGKSIKIGGYLVEVIGVIKKEGTQFGGGESHDPLVVVPANFSKLMIDFRYAGPTIMVKAKDEIPSEELMDELRGILRAARKLKPIEDDDFALNQVSTLREGIDNIFVAINLAGWIIGGFSILVGGFGIANIMFVSVKERTNIIGIQKALGAKNTFILVQFLYESVLLSIIGGAIGLLLIFLGSLLVNSVSEFTITLSLSNIILGITISAVIGILSGFAPAWQASKLNPVEAINTKT